MNISKFFKMSAVALAAAGFSGVALADTAETKGGLKIKTDDGRFEMSIGGRIQWDYYFVNQDDDAEFGSGIGTGSQNAGFFRRARLSFAGKLYGWEYLFVPEFSQNSGGIGGGTGTAASTTGTGATAAAAGVFFQELFVATDLWGGKLFIGQFKPFRGIEELTSSNEITFLERPFTTASGLYTLQFVQGLGYQKVFADMFNVATDVYTLKGDNAAASSVTTGGYGMGGRVVFSPVHTEGLVAHLGASYAYERTQNNAVLTTNVRYAGRRGGQSGVLTTSAANSGVQYFAMEAAGVLGPVYFQGEIGKAQFGQAGTATNLGATAFHTAASWFVTGETKPYDMKKGVFKSPKPINSWGAIELTTRYEYIDDEGAITPAVAGAAANEMQDVSTFTVGANYYLNPNVRFMVNYNWGNATITDDRKDKPESIGIRTHLYW